MNTWTTVLMIAGSAIVFLGALGVFRMPDLYNRMQASSKASSLGVILLLLAVCVHFPEIEVRARAVAAALFVFLTTPVGAHLLVRAAYRTGIPLWGGTHLDELGPSVSSSSKAASSPDNTRAA